MKTAASLEHKRFLEHRRIKGAVVTDDKRQTLRHRKAAVLRQKIYWGLIDSAKSIAVIFILLAFYKISGLSDLWILLVEYLFK